MKILYNIETIAADKATQELAANGQPVYDHVLVTYENQADHTSTVISYRTDFHIPVIPENHPHKSWQWVQREIARRKKGAELVQQFAQYRTNPEGFLEALRKQGAVADDCYVYNSQNEKFRAPACSVTNTQTGKEIYIGYETCGTPTMGPHGQKSASYFDSKTGNVTKEYRYDPNTGLLAGEVDWSKSNIDKDRVPAIEYVRDKTGNVVYKLCTIYQPRQNIYTIIITDKHGQRTKGPNGIPAVISYDMRHNPAKVFPAVVTLDNTPGMPRLSDKIYKHPVLLKAWIAHCVNGEPIDIGVSHNRAMQAAQQRRSLTAAR